MAAANSASGGQMLRGLDERRRAATRRKLRALRLLLVAAIVIPAAALTALAWGTWRDTWRGAQTELAGSAGAIAEYSLRVLDNHRLVADQVNEMLRGLSDDALRAREREFHEQLRRMIPRLPLVQTIAVNDRQGRMLLTANVYPVPRDQDFSDREWIQALRRADAPLYFVSRVYVGRLDNFIFFAVARRRTESGNGLPADAFDGAVNISVEPERFAAGFGDIIAPFSDVVAVVRDDGEVIARRPSFATPPPAGRVRIYSDLIAAGVDHGTVPSTDGVTRLAALRRINGYPLYAVVQRDVPAVVSVWRDRVAVQLALGLPAMALMIGFAWIALRRGRESAVMQESLAEETARRAAAEAAAEADARFRAVFESRGEAKCPGGAEPKELRCVEG